MTRKRVLLLSALAAVAVLAILAVILQRQRVRRHRVFRPAAGEVKTTAPAGIPPVEEWTATFQTLEAGQLATLLDAIEKRHPALYRRWSLAYLHARALVDADRNAEAVSKLGPFVEKGHPFRSRALYHRAGIADDAEASRYREALIFEHRDSPWRDEAIDEELEALSGDAGALSAFAKRISASASTERRREIAARIVEVTGSLEGGLAILRGGTADDAADRVVRTLDKAPVLARLNAEQLAVFGETMQQHRHYDRATAILTEALKKGYSDDLQFALGRSFFGAEQFGDAQAVYLRGAAVTKAADRKCTFLWHAARSAQLRGDDRTAEQLMTQAIAVKGKFPATLAALTQRLRTRMKQRRFANAAADLALLRKMAPTERALLEGSLAYAVGMLGAGNTTAALSALDAVPRKLLDDHDEAEFAYWRARALEERDPPAAFRSYLEVLRSKAPSHFAYLARTRLDSPAMAARLTRELAVREAQVGNLIAGGKLDLAKRIQTDRILLSSRDHPRQLQVLTSIYQQLPAYKAALDLKPAALPRFPEVDATDPDALLMAMGLHDEAVGAIQKRWGLRPPSDALTRSYALYLGGASRDSIYAIEVMMKALPADFHPDLLPDTVRRLLYPRYFSRFIAEDAGRYGADPTLVLSIMREESRFNPRAKSQAAARGLLQFIITTARDIGRDVGLVDIAPEDLYDPRVIIRLGAKYLSELGSRFEGNRYRIAAAYNAGPNQVELWNRLQAGPGDDYFITAVSFDETKHYVRKVMNSYERYQEIYGSAGPKGGLRVEP